MADFNKILAIDTAVAACAVAVLDTQSGESWSELVETDRRQAEILVPMIDSVMKKSATAFSDLDRIAVTVGPGSFTGVRIGLSTARSLALAAGKPLIGLGTLDVLAATVPDLSCLVVIDTKRGDYYGALYQPAGLVAEAARIWSAEEVEAIRVSRPELRIVAGTPDPVLMARLAAGRPAPAGEEVLPVYLRGAEISQPKRVAPAAV